MLVPMAVHLPERNWRCVHVSTHMSAHMSRHMPAHMPADRSTHMSTLHKGLHTCLRTRTKTNQRRFHERTNPPSLTIQPCSHTMARSDPHALHAHEHARAHRGGGGGKGGVGGGRERDLVSCACLHAWFSCTHAQMSTHTAPFMSGYTDLVDQRVPSAASLIRSMPTGEHRGTTAGSERGIGTA